ncbi:helix-turn-helix domain-containing protein, partial [Brucella sp. 22210]|uniref:helix-turn-helix domain-containing protein n=1 Tax=Brucella sp. 22210 TaxID=3453892 RepID=UPI003F832985
MAYPTITDEQLLQTLEAISAFPHKKDAAEYLGISDRTLRYRVKWAAERGLSPQANVLPGFAIKQKSEKQSDGSWIKQARAPGDIFKVPDN